MKPVISICRQCVALRKKTPPCIHDRLDERMAKGKCAYLLGREPDGVPKECPFIAEQTVSQEQP